MKAHKETIILIQKKEVIYNVIANIENYPTFFTMVYWCKNNRY